MEFLRPSLFLVCRSMPSLEECYRNTSTERMHHPHMLRCLQNLFPNSTADQLLLGPMGVVWRGVYADGLERWFSVFPKESFLFWVSG